MTDHANKPLSAVEVVVEYLSISRRNMRTYPLEGEFQEGYERAFNDIIYHVMTNTSSQRQQGEELRERWVQLA